jgi:transcriptional regulator with XRE-family HTH domain
MLNIGEKIKKTRLVKEMSQSELAKKAGLSNDYMNRIELEKVVNIGIEKLAAIAKALDVHIDDLISTKSQEPPENADISMLDPLWGEKISLIRKKKNLSLEELANNVDIPIEELQIIENGEYYKKDQNCDDLLKYLNIDADLFSNVSYELWDKLSLDRVINWDNYDDQIPFAINRKEIHDLTLAEWENNIAGSKYKVFPKSPLLNHEDSFYAVHFFNAGLDPFVNFGSIIVLSSTQKINFQDLVFIATKTGKIHAGKYREHNNEVLIMKLKYGLEFESFKKTELAFVHKIVMILPLYAKLEQKLQELADRDNKYLRIMGQMFPKTENEAIAKFYK